MQALVLLGREHRIFDVARILLWKAEAGESVPDLAQTAATFEELGAHPYLERMRKLWPRTSHWTAGGRG